MYRKLNLKSMVWHKPDLELEWDPATGGLRGRDAPSVRALIGMAMQAGEVVTHPMPTSYDIHDPLHEPRDMALVLGQYWELPPDLAAALPAADNDETPGILEGEDGKEIRITPIH